MIHHTSHQASVFATGAFCVGARSIGKFHIEKYLAITGDLPLLTPFFALCKNMGSCLDVVSWLEVIRVYPESQIGGGIIPR